MQLQQFSPKMISITQLRRDIDVLENVLAKNREALVVRNQDVLFVALTFKRYQEITSQNQKISIDEAVKGINTFRAQYGKTKRKNAGSSYIIKMRDETRKRWTKRF
ncbi:hypothetical protein HZB97_03155 [Candidatus Gottesmanbacteria bacterium]|nr:hypothetical protein [Candidatus Gottesmanbacteria bacterium]